MHLFRFAIGPILACFVWILPLGLPPEAQRLAGLMVWVMAWWILETLPLAATALFGASASVFLGIATAKEAYAPFAHPIVLLFMGGFFIAKAMSVHGLDRRIALFVLTRELVARKPIRIVLALMLVTAFLSMFISNTATTAMLLPITLGILGATFPNKGSLHATILLSVAYAATIGGVATPIGSTPNIIALGMLDRLLGFQISFFEWMSFAFPMMLVTLSSLAMITWMRLRNHLPSSSSKSAIQEITGEFQALGKMKMGEMTTIVAASITVFLWTFPSIIKILLGHQHELSAFLKTRFPEGVSAILGATFLFLLPSSLGKNRRPTLRWEEATQIDWNSLLLFGGGLSLGGLMFKTGLAEVISTALVSGVGGSTWLFLAAIIVFTIFLTETTSNTATANMLIPLVIASSQSLGASPVIGAIGVSFACSFAFMMPVSTPPNAIVYGSKKIPIKLMIRKGFVLNLLAIAIILATMYLLRDSRLFQI